MEKEKDRKPVVLIIGAGSGIGGSVARRFAAGGYHVCLCRRSNSKALEEAVKAINDDYGGRRSNNNNGVVATGFILDVTSPQASNQIETIAQKIENDIGGFIQIAIYNIGAQIGSRSLQETTYKQFELGWKLGTLGLFRLAKCLVPRMARSNNGSGRGGGCLLVTSSTASVRGDAGQHSHAAAMGGRRMLCQSLNAEFAATNSNIHVVHVVVDGPVNSPDTLGKLIGGKERLEQLQQQRPIISPQAVADTYWHLAHQPITTRTFELDLRSQADVPWWNSSSSSPSLSAPGKSKL